MDTITQPRRGRPRKSLKEKVEALINSAPPEEVAEFQSEAAQALKAVKPEDDCPIEWAPTAQNPKLQSLIPLCDSAMARMLSRVDGTWAVRCWVKDEQALDAPPELDEFGEPLPLSGCIKLGPAKVVQSCEPDVLGYLRKQGAHGEVTIEFLKAGNPPVQLTLALSAEVLRKPLAPAQANGQNALADTVRQLLDVIVRRQDALDEKLERALTRPQPAPRQDFDPGFAERLEAERERLRADLEAQKRNDPAYSAGRELLSAIVQGGMQRVKSAVLGEASPAAPNGLAGAAPASPLSPAKNAAEMLRAAREDYEIAKAMFGEKPEPSLMEQAQAVGMTLMQIYAMWQSIKGGQPSGALQVMQGLNQLAAQPGLPAPAQPNLPAVNGDELLRELEAKGKSAVA